MTTDEEVRCSFVVNLDKVLLAKQKVGIEKVFFHRSGSSNAFLVQPLDFR